MRAKQFYNLIYCNSDRLLKIDRHGFFLRLTGVAFTIGYEELLEEAQNIASVRTAYLEEKVLFELGSEDPLLQQQIDSAIAHDAEMVDLRSKVDEAAAVVRKMRASAQ